MSLTIRKTTSRTRHGNFDKNVTDIDVITGLIPYANHNSLRGRTLAAHRVTKNPF